MSKAYADLKSLSLTATVVGHFDVAGRSKTFTMPVTGLTDGQGRFVHRAENSGLLISDGTDAYLFDSKRNAFGKLDVTPGRMSVEQLDDSIVNVMLDENPSLLLAISDDAAALLKDVATSIHLANGSLVLETADKRYTFDLDPITHLIVRSTIDYAPGFAARGAKAVKSVSAVVTYDPPKRDGQVNPADFSWTPPGTSTEISLGRELLHKQLSPPAPTTAP